MKIQGYGQAEIELLFKEGFQTERDHVLFGVCLYTACRIAEACSLMVKDIYTNSGTVRSSINFRKGNTKGKLQTRTIPVIEDLRSLLTSWRPNAGLTYLFPSRHRRHHKYAIAIQKIISSVCSSVAADFQKIWLMLGTQKQAAFTALLKSQL